MMKKILLMCCFLLGISAVSFAQQGGGMRRSPEEQAKRLKEQLSLTDDQTSKLVVILQGESKTRDSLMTAANGDRNVMMQGFRSMMEKRSAKIKSILTPEQVTAYDKMLAEQRSRMQNAGGSAPTQR
jgi:protein CpxP